MSGFLDKNTRVIDMTLTCLGKELLSKGSLKFVYWMPFDDEVDYNPKLMNSASIPSDMMSSSISSQIDETLIVEAAAGYTSYNRIGLDNINVSNPIFTMPQGQKIVPKISSPSQPLGGHILESTQQKIIDKYIKGGLDGQRDPAVLNTYDRGYMKFNNSITRITLDSDRNSFPNDFKQVGYAVRVYKVVEDALIEVKNRYDLKNNISYNNDLVLSLDD